MNNNGLERVYTLLVNDLEVDFVIKDEVSFMRIRQPSVKKDVPFIGVFRDTEHGQTKIDFYIDHIKLPNDLHNVNYLIELEVTSLNLQATKIIQQLPDVSDKTLTNVMVERTSRRLSFGEMMEFALYYNVIKGTTPGYVPPEEVKDLNVWDENLTLEQKRLIMKHCKADPVYFAWVVNQKN